jgi:hypothetical protein
MMGTWTVTIHDVRPFTIHGDVYYELNVWREDQPADHRTLLRIPQHAADRQLRAADRVAVTFLMGQVTSVKVIA